jgi:cytochrome b subunit of formate dehydrogenase
MSDDRVIRHRGPDRLFHWITAASVIVLLATGLLHSSACASTG